MDLVKAEQEVESSALADLYDAAQADVVPAPVGGLSQADVDAAVLEKTAEIQAHLDEKQAELNAEVAADAVDKAALADKQKLIDGIRALLSPPAPVADPAPAETPPEAPAAQ